MVAFHLDLQFSEVLGIIHVRKHWRNLFLRISLYKSLVLLVYWFPHYLGGAFAMTRFEQVITCFSAIYPLPTLPFFCCDIWVLPVTVYCTQEG